MSQRSLWTLLFVIMAFAGTSLAVGAQPASQDSRNRTSDQLYAISGTVYDPTGNPLALAQMIGFPELVGQNLAIGTTAADGTYTLNVIAGRYHIQASKPGLYAAHVYNVIVPPSLTGVDLALSELPDSATATPISSQYKVYLPQIKKDGSPASAPDATATTTPAGTATATTPTGTATATAIATATPSITPTPSRTPSPTLTPTRTSTPIPAIVPRDGHWAGKTSDNKPMSFDIASSGTSWRNFALQFSGAAGSCSSFTAEVSFDGPGPITNNQFNFRNPESTLFISGQFTSQRAAHGSYRFTNFFIFYPCFGPFSETGTWTATTP
jgi:hypothetical protein